MGSLMTYKGYHAAIEYSNKDKIFVGKVHGISDNLNFHGQSVDELEKMFHQSIDNYLDLCKQIGKQPEKEYSGIFNVRIPVKMHKKLTEEALEDHETLNAKVVEIFKEYFANKENPIRKGVYAPYHAKPDKPFGVYENR